ncbi:hypothetical protein ICE98_00028 [Lactococcus lactis]|nr:hypothetical protein [Lactococcus lactis]
MIIKLEKTYVDAQLFFVANMIKHNTSTSHELLSHIKDDETVISTISEREIFNKATTKHLSIFDFAKTQDKKDDKVLNNINDSFSKIYNHTKIKEFKL